jgi:hypothetical protein
MSFLQLEMRGMNDSRSVVGRMDLPKRVGMFHLLFVDHTVAGDEVKRLFYLTTPICIQFVSTVACVA